LGRLALGGFSFYYKRKNAAMDDYLKSSTPTFILEPLLHGKQTFKCQSFEIN